MQIQEVNKLFTPGMSVSLYSGILTGFVTNVDWSINNYGKCDTTVQITQYNNQTMGLSLDGLFLDRPVYGPIQKPVPTLQQRSVGIMQREVSLRNWLFYFKDTFKINYSIDYGWVDIVTYNQQRYISLKMLISQINYSIYYTLEKNAQSSAKYISLQRLTAQPHKFLKSTDPSVCLIDNFNELYVAHNYSGYNPIDGYNILLNLNYISSISSQETLQSFLIQLLQDISNCTLNF